MPTIIAAVSITGAGSYLAICASALRFQLGYAYEHIRPGKALELIRKPADQNDGHAVAYHHRGVHLDSTHRSIKYGDNY